MTTPDHDTNPSTPSSKRASDPRVAVPGSPAPDGHPGKPLRMGRPTTDPGVAPQSEPLPVPGHPMGIVVPSVAPNTHDSVDILLEGISSEQPEPPKTTPQTEGQSAAAYHVEHAVRAPQAAPSQEPTVVIDGPALGRTVRLGRSALSAPDVDGKAWTETTEVKVLPSASRVVIAVVAGLMVVLVIFVALQRTSPGGPAVPVGAPATVRTAAVVPAPSAVAAAESTGVAATPPKESPAPSPPPPVSTESAPAAPSVSATSGTARKAPPAAKPSRAKPRPAASAAKSPGGDLGEFKGSF